MIIVSGLLLSVSLGMMVRSIVTRLTLRLSLERNAMPTPVLITNAFIHGRKGSRALTEDRLDFLWWLADAGMGIHVLDVRY